jgi:NAD(P)-dependent dehydrogenase (short-subunit alcohol dehydrogenase family)
MRNALVTAAGAGIGHAIAGRLIAAGYRVFGCDLSANAFAKTEGMEHIVADISRPSDVTAMFDQIVATAGTLDLLVNNAGIGGPRAPLDEIEPDAWDVTIAVNLNGMFYCMRAAAALMKAAGSGVIVNISTSSVLTGLPLRAPYVASKAGVLGLTRNAARELGPHGIRCNAILPGLIDNPRGRALVQKLADERGQSFAETEAGFLRYISLRCWIDPSEIGDLTVFLASDAARHITGQSIAVDGNVEWEE